MYADNEPRIPHRIDERRDLILLHDRRQISLNGSYLEERGSYEKLCIDKNTEEVVVSCKLHRGPHAA